MMKKDATKHLRITVQNSSATLTFFLSLFCSIAKNQIIFQNRTNFYYIESKFWHQIPAVSHYWKSWQNFPKKPEWKKWRCPQTWTSEKSLRKLECQEVVFQKSSWSLKALEVFWISQTMVTFTSCRNWFEQQTLTERKLIDKWLVIRSVWCHYDNIKVHPSRRN